MNDRKEKDEGKRERKKKDKTRRTEPSIYIRAGDRCLTYHSIEYAGTSNASRSHYKQVFATIASS